MTHKIKSYECTTFKIKTNIYSNILPSLEAECRQRTTPNAVPKYAVANEPVLQCVKIRTCSPSVTLFKIALAPNSPIDLLSDISFSNIASIAATNLTNKLGNVLNNHL